MEKKERWQAFIPNYSLFPFLVKGMMFFSTSKTSLSHIKDCVGGVGERAQIFEQLLRKKVQEAAFPKSPLPQGFSVRISAGYWGPVKVSHTVYTQRSSFNYGLGSWMSGCWSEGGDAVLCELGWTLLELSRQLRAPGEARYAGSKQQWRI